MSGRDRHDYTHMQTSTKVYVGGLIEGVSNGQLEEIFEKHGRVERVWVARHPTSRGYAFIDFYNRRDAEEAVDKLNDTHHFGNKLKVEIAKLDAHKLDSHRKEHSSKQRLLSSDNVDPLKERSLLDTALLTESAILRETLLRNSLSASYPHLLQNSLLLNDPLLNTSASLDLSHLGLQSLTNTSSRSPSPEAISSRRQTKSRHDKPYNKTPLLQSRLTSSDSINITDILAQKLELEKLLLHKTALNRLGQRNVLHADDLSPLSHDTQSQQSGQHSNSPNYGYSTNWNSDPYAAKPGLLQTPRPIGHRPMMHTPPSDAPPRMPFGGRPLPPHMRDPRSTFFSHRHLRPPRMRIPPPISPFGCHPRMIRHPPSTQN